jgi:hypothetical protein
VAQTGRGAFPARRSPLRRLVTTRIDGVLPAATARAKVDAQGAEALSLLSGGLPADQTTRERAGLRQSIVLLEEFRRNDPNQGDQRDKVAETLAEPADAQVVLDAIRAAEKADGRS